jgi:hypothetical protein
MLRPRISPAKISALTVRRCRGNTFNCSTMEVDRHTKSQDESFCRFSQGSKQRMISVQSSGVQHQPSSCSARVEGHKIISNDGDAVYRLSCIKWKFFCFRKSRELKYLNFFPPKKDLFKFCAVWYSEYQYNLYYKKTEDCNLRRELVWYGLVWARIIYLLLIIFACLRVACSEICVVAVKSCGKMVNF